MRVLLALLTLWLVALPAGAVDVSAAQSEALELEEIEDAARPYLDGITMENVDLDAGLSAILDTGTAQLEGVVRKAVRSATLLLAVVVFCGVAGSLTEGGPAKGLPVTSLVGALAITAVAAADVESLLGLGEETLSAMTDFANLLFPAVTALTAATGAITGAAVRQMAAMLFADLLMNLMSRLLMPIIYSYLAASVAHSALGSDGLKRVASFLKWAVTLILTVVLMAFTAYLTLSGVIAGHADAATVKAAKFAMSSAIPVVGGILSDAAETVLAGAGVLRGTVGVYGMLAVLAMCLTPFLRLGVHFLVYKLTAALAATVADGPSASLIDSVGAAFGLILGMTGAGTLILIISLVSALSVTSL